MCVFEKISKFVLQFFTVPTTDKKFNVSVHSPNKDNQRRYKTIQATNMWLHHNSKVLRTVPDYAKIYWDVMHLYCYLYYFVRTSGILYFTLFPQIVGKKCAFKQLQTFLDTCGICEEFQPDFKSYHSTEATLLRVFNDRP